MEEHRFDALAAALARTDGRRRSTVRVLGRWLRGAPARPTADRQETAGLPALSANAEPADLARRRLLIRGAAAAGAAVWIPPVIQSITMPAAAGVGSPPPGPGCPQSCLADTECCNRHCEGASPPDGFGTCCNLTGQTGDGSDCNTNADCCNNIHCHSGVCCARPTPGDDTGFCLTVADCCPEMKNCQGGSPPDTFGTCCNHSGIDPVQNFCENDVDCCDQHTCRTTTVNAGTCCTPDTGHCDSNDECCSGVCDVDTCVST